MNKNKEKRKQDEMIQKIIDPSTGKDVTGEYIRERLDELALVADEIIKIAIKTCNALPENKVQIYEEAYWDIHQKLGMGSIGPATAAAGPLMTEKIEKLAKKLHISEDQQLH